MLVSRSLYTQHILYKPPLPDNYPEKTTRHVALCQNLSGRCTDNISQSSRDQAEQLRWTRVEVVHNTLTVLGSWAGPLCPARMYQLSYGM